MLGPLMRLSGRTRSTFVLFLLLGVLIGSLAWEVLERILSRFGVELGMSLGPVGFDLAVLAVSLVLNPGSLLGALGGVLLFRLL
jgi:hypothetical protein